MEETTNTLGENVTPSNNNGEINGSPTNQGEGETGDTNGGKTNSNAGVSSHFPFWKGDGYFYTGNPGNSYGQEKIEFDLPKPTTNTGIREPVPSMGKLVTKRAANVMMKKLEVEFNSKFEEYFTGDKHEAAREAFESLMPHRVIFGKEALLFLLGQAGCEGVRFYYCMGPNEKPSLVLVGVNIEEKDLGEETGTIYDPESTNVPDKDPQQPKAVERQKSAIVEVGGTDKSTYKVETFFDKSMRESNTSTN